MLSPNPEQSLENRKSQGKVKYGIVLIKIIINRLAKQLISNGEHSFFSEIPDKKDAQSSKNRNLDMLLISAPSGRFPWARLQPLPLLTLSPGSSARAVPTGVAALRSNQLYPLSMIGKFG